MTTAFLGAYGYGNLGDELCLIEAMRAFPDPHAFAFSAEPDWTTRCAPGLAGCFQDAEGLRALRPDRIVFGGGLFGTAAAFAAWMPWMAEAMGRGAAVHLHNLGVARIKVELGWLDEDARRVIAGAASFTVRDYVSFEMVAEAGLGRLPRISFYPEVDIPAEPDLAAALLPQGVPLLGLSIIGTRQMQDCLRADGERVLAMLAEFPDHQLVPIASTVHLHDAEEDDIAGAEAFMAEFLPGARLAAPILLDRAHRHAALTPARLKGLIARCDVLVTQRKHNAIHGIGAGVRTIGLHPIEDDSLRRSFVALTHRLPPGSRCIGLEPAP
jgi:hypothetical protein